MGLFNALLESPYATLVTRKKGKECHQDRPAAERMGGPPAPHPWVREKQHWCSLDQASLPRWPPFFPRLPPPCSCLSPDFLPRAFLRGPLQERSGGCTLATHPGLKRGAHVLALTGRWAEPTERKMRDGS